MIVGIDPGITGAVALLEDNGELIDVLDMPVSAKANGKGQHINARLLFEMIFQECDVIKGETVTAIIERVHAMPGQGVTSVFGFGRTLGVIEGVLAGAEIPVEWVTPQKWKKQFGIIGKDKDAARTLVIEKYPAQSELFKRKKDIGRADAVLIGLTGLKK